MTLLELQFSLEKAHLQFLDEYFPTIRSILYCDGTSRFKKTNQFLSYYICTAHIWKTRWTSCKITLAAQEDLYSYDDLLLVKVYETFKVLSFELHLVRCCCDFVECRDRECSESCSVERERQRERERETDREGERGRRQHSTIT